MSQTQPSLESALQECIRELEAGRPLGAEQVRARWPGLAEGLLGCLEALAFVQQAGADVRPAGPAPLFGAEPLGDYRILREVGRGGMGVVYEAEQVSLGRRVALKVLPFAAAVDPRQLQRFQQEARAAAHLTHPHIVPVFGVGCERGVHYYAMQFIDGQPLTELVRARRREAGLDEAPDALATTGPLAQGTTLGQAQATPRPGSSTPREQQAYFRRVAELGAQAADALQHAHEFGIVHRDVKPGNLMLDGQGKLWVTDFGLARLGGDANLTRTGDLLGTARYMSPEQAQGLHSSLDHRSDVYSLGATLYELLTLTPAVPGDDRMAVLRKIADEDPPPPRKLSPEVPLDLETVVLKAMAKEPEARYQSAGEFAADLRRFLADEAVQARRPTWWQTAERLFRRYRAAFQVAFGVLLLAVLGLTVALVLINNERSEKAGKVEELQREKKKTLQALADADRANKELERTNRKLEKEKKKTLEALAKANTEKKNALKANNRSWDAVEGYTRAVLKVYEQLPLQEGLERELTEKAREVYRELLAQHPSDFRGRLRMATAYLQVGGLHLRRAENDQAVKAFRDAIAQLEGLKAEAEEEARLLAHKVAAWTALGQALATLRQYEQSVAAFREALAHQTRLVLVSKDRLGAESNLAVIRGNLAISLLNAGKPHKAERDLAARASRKLIGQHPEVAEYKAALIALLNNEANFLADQGRPRDAEPCLREALSLLDEADRTASKDLLLVRQLGHYRGYVSQTLGRVLYEQGKTKEAEAAYLKALAARERICQMEPLYLFHRRGLVGTLTSLGIVRRQLGKSPEADLRRAVQVLEETRRDFPNDKMTADKLQHGHFLLGEWLLEVGNNAEAEKAFRRCGEVAAELNEKWGPGTAPLRPAEAANKVCLALMAQGKAAEALEALKAAEKLIQPHLRQSPAAGDGGGPSLAFETMAQCLINRATLRRRSAPAKAEADLVAALGVLDEAPKKGGKVSPRVLLQRSRALTNLASLRMSRPREQAKKLFDEARALLEGLVKEDDKYAEAHADLGAAYMNQAVFARIGGDTRSARALMVKAIQEQKTALELAPFSARSRDFLHRQYRQQAGILYQMRDHQGLAKLAEDLSKAFPRDWATALEASQALAAAYELAGADASLGAEKRAFDQEQHARKIRAMLDRLARLGKGIGEAEANLAYFLVTTAPPALRDPARAAEHAQKARAAAPGLLAGWEAEALAHYRAGRPRLALELIGSYRPRLKSPSALTEYVAALCHARVGEADRAKACLSSGDWAFARVRPPSPEMSSLAREAKQAVGAKK